MIHRLERFFPTSGTILGNAHEPLGSWTALRMAYSFQPLSQSLSHRFRHVFPGAAGKFFRELVCFRILDVKRHIPPVYHIIIPFYHLVTDQKSSARSTSFGRQRIAPCWTSRWLLAYKRFMGFWRKLVGIGLAVIAICAIALAADFEWNWRDQQTIGRTDPSLGNTSRLTEPDRAALIDAIVLRLQKPMSERGYDDERIREIASTTRLRFVDLGGDKPLLFATSLGLEGGCDAMANCPLWIFRHSQDGYVSVLDAVASSYTIQPTSTNGISDLVVVRHESPTESHLTVYTYADGKYSDSGCYMAKWPAAKDSDIQDPDITPCKAEATKPAQTEDSTPKAPDSAPAKTDDSKPANSDDSAAPKTNDSNSTQSQDSSPAKADDSTPAKPQDSNPAK